MTFQKNVQKAKAVGASYLVVIYLKGTKHIKFI